ncbi:MAG: aspartyl protease family protein [Stappiaceae bacterium]
MKNHRRILLATLCSLSIATSSSAALAADKKSENPNNILMRTTHTVPAGEHQVPFDFSFGMPIISVKIGGKMRRFAFDTGAVMTLDAKLADELKLLEETAVKVTDSQGLSQQRGVLVVPEMELGPASFKNQPAIVADLNHPESPMACVKLDGLFGNTAMRLIRSWSIDYDKKKITFSEDPMAIDADALVSSASNMAGSGPRVNTRFGKGIETDIIIDTGKQGGFTLPVSFMGELAGAGRLAPAPVLRLMSFQQSGINKKSDPISYFFARIDGFRFGQARMGSVPFSFLDAQPFVGNAALKYFKINFDFQQGLVALKPKGSGFLNLVGAFQIQGVERIMEKGKVYVSAVYEGLKQPVRGVEIGDEILQIDNVKMIDGDIQPICQLMTAPPAPTGVSTYVLKDKKGRKKTVKLPFQTPFSLR